MYKMIKTPPPLAMPDSGHHHQNLAGKSRYDTDQSELCRNSSLWPFPARSTMDLAGKGQSHGLLWPLRSEKVKTTAKDIAIVFYQQWLRFGRRWSSTTTISLAVVTAKSVNFWPDRWTFDYFWSAGRPLYRFRLPSTVVVGIWQVYVVGVFLLIFKLF